MCHFQCLFALVGKRRHVNASFSPSLSRFSRKEHKKGLGSHGWASGETVVTYFFCGEEIPYRRTMSSHSLTLGHFKEQLRKKGSYRWVQRLSAVKPNRSSGSSGSFRSAG